MSTARRPRRGSWLKWVLLPAAIAALALGASVRHRTLRSGLQTPTFHVPSTAELSQSPAAQRLRSGAAGAHVIIVLLDAAGADHFTSFGYERNTTPNIAEFQRKSVLFTQAYSAAASTKPSVASLFTGQFPDTHGTLALPSRLAPGNATLAECLRKAGYATAAFSASPSVAKSFGYNRGFDFFHEVFRDAGLDPAGPNRRSFSALPVDGAMVVASAVDWLQSHKDQRVFAYIHFREPHYPYVSPRSFQVPFRPPVHGQGSNKIRYDATLAYVDSLVGGLLRELDAQGVLDKSVVVLLADHGEAFGEHGSTGHSSTPYIEMTHVPLTFHLPAQSSVAPQRRSEIICLTDVMPTLLDLLQIAPPKTMQGRSRLGLLAGEQEKTPAFAVSRALGEDHTGGKTDSGQVSYALRVPGYTLVLANRGQRVELYDRSADPGELHDIAAERPDAVRKLRAQFEQWAASQRGRPVVLPGGRVYSAEGKESDLDEATRRQLKTLGYLK